MPVTTHQSYSIIKQKTTIQMAYSFNSCTCRLIGWYLNIKISTDGSSLVHPVQLELVPRNCDVVVLLFLSHYLNYSKTVHTVNTFIHSFIHSFIPTINSTKHSPPWKAISSSNQKVLCILYNWKVHYCVPDGPPMEPILSYDLLTHFFIINYNTRLSWHLSLHLTSGLFPSDIPISSYVVHIYIFSSLAAVSCELSSLNWTHTTQLP
jgi:hypothetical protein